MFGPPAALLILAQAATADVAHPPYGPAPSAPAPAPAKVPECAPQPAPAKANAIVVCAVKPNGYRLPPDVVEAKRLKKRIESGRPRNPHETYANHSCAVGPLACTGTPAINVIAAAMTAAEISKRLAKGQEVGSIFETTPHPSDYQLYQEAKRRREAKEADAAAKKAQAAAQAAEAAKKPAE